MFKKYLTSIILSLVAVGGFFINITNTENQLIFDSTTTIGISVSNAQDCFTPECLAVVKAGNDKIAVNNQDAEIQKMLNKLVEGINIFLSILTIIVTPAIMLATWLMSPDWTAGDIFGLRPVFHSLWVTISNITYFIYAILLIFIALATIFNSENYGYKAMLPKLALGIILVPLTWWAVQFTISLATYVTATVISIPAESIEKFSSKNDSFWSNPSIPKNLEFSKVNDPKTYNCANGCYSPREVVSKAGGMFSPLLIYSFSVFKIQDIKSIRTGPEIVTSILDIVHQGIIGIIMFIVYGLLVMALIFLLMMRAIKLWFYAIFSPLFTIKYVLGDKAFGDADKDGSMNITEFIGLAFVPAVVCLALSFGLVIISAMIAPFDVTNNPNNKCEGEVCTIYIMGTTENKIESRFITEGDKKFSQTTITIGGVSYSWKGNVSGGELSNAGLKSALGATGNMFGKIIVDIIALVFIWIAFMAGKGISKAASAAIEPFEQLGKKIGDMGMSLPKYTPIPGTGGVSIAGAGKITDMARSEFESKMNKKAYDTPLAKMLNVSQDGKNVEGQKARVQQMIGKTGLSPNELLKIQKDTRDIIAAHGLSSSEGRKWMDNLAKIFEDNGRKHTGEGLYDSAGNIKDGGLWLLEGDINSGMKKKDPKDEDKKKWKNKQENPSNGEVDSGKNTTNNTFNVKVLGGDKYSLKAGDNLDLAANTKESLLKDLNKNIASLVDINPDQIKKELKLMQATDKEIEEILNAIDKKKKESDGKTSGGGGGPA